MSQNSGPGKRKRNLEDSPASTAKKRAVAPVLQIITGSYERVLHGLAARISLDDSHRDNDTQRVSFSDQFLFNAHKSSIRCLAVSPPSAANSDLTPSKCFLATGGADQCINVYSLSARAPSFAAAKNHTSLLPLAPAPDPSSRNFELGSLTQHDSTISHLHFISRGKLLSASQDNTISIVRSRDWSVLSTIRAPIPNPAGRPSGDTAAPGEVPAGINGVAVHPSAKLCLSVGQGERCMRLWNLVTGKKAGVLTFEKPILSLLDEGRWRGGEGKSVVWSDDGNEFAVGFERGAVIYGLDCQVRAVARVSGAKCCQMRYISLPAFGKGVVANGDGPEDESAQLNILGISTEDGRILFFKTTPSKQGDGAVEADAEYLLVGSTSQLGSLSRGTRIKDFLVFQHSSLEGGIFVVTGSSDGVVSVWKIETPELQDVIRTANQPSKSTKESEVNYRQVGTLLGTQQTGRRITCLAGFIMDSPSAVIVNGSANADEEEEEAFEGFQD